MSTRREEELDALIGGEKKRRGCCTSHPILCTSTLAVISMLCIVVLVCGVVLHPIIDQKVQDAIAEVSPALLAREGVGE